MGRIQFKSAIKSRKQIGLFRLRFFGGRQINNFAMCESCCCWCGGVVVVVVVVEKFLQHVFKFILCVFCGFLSQPRHRHSLPTVDIGANLTETIVSILLFPDLKYSKGFNDETLTLWLGCEFVPRHFQLLFH